MVVYSSARLGVNPQINALATLLIGAVCIGMAVALLVGRRARR
jgi:ABC-type spermidine/putrescine transport system permease subunit II